MKRITIGLLTVLTLAIQTGCAQQSHSSKTSKSQTTSVETSTLVEVTDLNELDGNYSFDQTIADQSFPSDVEIKSGKMESKLTFTLPDEPNTKYFILSKGTIQRQGNKFKMIGTYVSCGTPAEDMFTVKKERVSGTELFNPFRRIFSFDGEGDTVLSMHMKLPMMGTPENEVEDIGCVKLNELINLKNK